MATAKNIAQAIAAFQADLPAIDLDGTNPHFKSKYATLSNVTKKVLPALAKNGLSFTTGSFVDNGTLILDAHLLHESGESRSMQFPITEANPQKVGSAVTYYRRYALAALTGVVADEDDDGNAASQPSPTERKLDAARSRPAPKAPAGNGGTAQAKIRDWIGTDDDRKEQANSVVQRIKTEKGLSGAALYEAAISELGV